MGAPWLQYNLEYYLEMADALVTHGVHTLAIKDMVGAVIQPAKSDESAQCGNAPP